MNRKLVVASAYRSVRIGLERSRHDFELLARIAMISKLGLSVDRESHPVYRNEATEPASDLPLGEDRLSR